MSTVHCKEREIQTQVSCCHLGCTIVSVSTTAWILKAAHMDPAENIFVFCCNDFDIVQSAFFVKN